MYRFFRTTTIRRLPARLRDRLLMQPHLQRVLHKFGNELDDKKWVFVLGCYNSGTTLLANLLQLHDKLGGLPNEGAFLSDALPYPERFGWPRMWCECKEEMKVPADDFDRAKRIRRQWSLWIRGNPGYVVEKSISNVLRIEFLANTFRDASFIYIVRNGFAVASGIQRKANLRRWKNPQNLHRYPIELCARQWVESDRIVQAAMRAGIPIMTIKYEDLAENPSQAVNTLFRTIGVDEAPTLSADITLDIHESRSAIRNMNAASIARLSVEDKRIIQTVANRELDFYGYDAAGGGPADAETMGGFSQ